MRLTTVDLEGHHNEGDQGKQEEKELDDVEAGPMFGELGEAALLLATIIGDDRSHLLGLVIGNSGIADALLDVAVVDLDGGRHC